MVPKYPRIFRNRFRFILVPKYSTTPEPSKFLKHSRDRLFDLCVCMMRINKLYDFQTLWGFFSLEKKFLLYVIL